MGRQVALLAPVTESRLSLHPVGSASCRALATQGPHGTTEWATAARHEFQHTSAQDCKRLRHRRRGAGMSGGAVLGPPCWETAPCIRAPVLTPPVGAKQSQVNEADRRVCSQSFIYSRAVLYRITEFTWSGALLFIFVLKKITGGRHGTSDTCRLFLLPGLLTFWRLCAAVQPVPSLEAGNDLADDKF